jgi:phosphate transport system substrate-binding protein
MLLGAAMVPSMPSLTKTNPWLLFVVALGLSGCTRREAPEAESDTSEDQEPTKGGTKAPAKAPGGTITLKGSDTMVILAQRWAEVFMREHDGFTVQVTGGGSGTGIAALINGTTDIATASRGMKDTEKAQVQAQRNGAAVETKVAIDALAVYVPDASPIQELSIPQLNKIFRGEITNWRQVGGPNTDIVLYGRENNSGTYVYFKEHVLDDADFAASTQTLPGTAAVINAVARDPNGIGYGGIAYAQGVRAIRIKATDDAPAVTPDMTTATNGTYPLARFLFFYTVGEPAGASRSFVDWVLSPAGQRVIENVGYYPLSTGTAAQAATPTPPSGT